MSARVSKACAERSKASRPSAIGPSCHCSCLCSEKNNGLENRDLPRPIRNSTYGTRQSRSPLVGRKCRAPLATRLPSSPFKTSIFITRVAPHCVNTLMILHAAHTRIVRIVVILKGGGVRAPKCHQAAQCTCSPTSSEQVLTCSLEVREEHGEVSVQLDEPLVDVLDLLYCSLGLTLLEAGGVLQFGQVVQDPG